MSKHGIANLTQLKKWARAYREGGPEALRPKPKGRPRKDGIGSPGPKSREQELEAENRRLRAEVAYLKNCVPWRRQGERLGEVPGDQGAFRARARAQGPAGRLRRAGVHVPLQQVEAGQGADQAGALGQGDRDLLALAERLRAPPDSDVPPGRGRRRHRRQDRSQDDARNRDKLRHTPGNGLPQVQLLQGRGRQDLRERAGARLQGGRAVAEARHRRHRVQAEMGQGVPRARLRLRKQGDRGMVHIRHPDMAQQKEMLDMLIPKIRTAPTRSCSPTWAGSTRT